jgi:hypothetical protein
MPGGKLGGLGACDIHAPGITFLAGKGSLAMEERDFVLLEQVQDAVVILCDDAVLARQHLRDIDRQSLDLDAVVGKRMPGVLEILRRLQQRL